MATHCVFFVVERHDNNFTGHKLFWHHTMDKFDLKLIPEFDGSPTDQSVIEWFEKAEQVCRLFKMKEPLMGPTETHERSLCGIPATWG